MGNEHQWTPQFTKFASSLYGLAKGLDPNRPVIGSDGNLPYPTGATNGLVDFYSWQNNDYAAFASLKQPTKPVISHETGNFNSFPRIEKSIADLTPPHGKASKFLKPFWLTDARDHLKATNLLHENELWSLRSEQLYVFTW